MKQDWFLLAAIIAALIVLAAIIGLEIYIGPSIVEVM